jgi:hypothetical protein
VPWFKEAVLGREATAAAGGLHFGWFVLAIGVIALGVSYVQAHRGLRGFARKLALVTALAAAYLWLMGVRFIDPQTAETVKFIRVAVNLGLVAVLVLQQVPWVHRRLAALGLGFNPPDRRPAARGGSCRCTSRRGMRRRRGRTARRAHAGRVHHRLSRQRDRGVGDAGQGLAVDVPGQGPRGVLDLGVRRRRWTSSGACSPRTRRVTTCSCASC